MSPLDWYYSMDTRTRLWWENKRKTGQNRFDVYVCDPNIANPQINGMLPASSDWKLATPDLKRNENIFLAGSNTWGSGIILQMKWRPNELLKLSTLITKFTLESGRNKPIYDYEEVWTQSQPNFLQDQQHQQYIRQYTGQNIKLQVLSPYKSYRIFFSGYMRDRQTKKLVYIRFRSIVANCGKLYDFKEQYDTKYMADQLATVRPNRGYQKTLHELILQDRHEHTVQFRCIYNLDDSEDEEKLFCWGFHARHFIDKQLNNENVQYKRILAYISNGISFHAGTMFVSNDPNQRIEFGYCCPRNQTTYPIQKFYHPANWTLLESEINELSFEFKCDNTLIQVKATKEEISSGSEFVDLIANGKKGRGLILLDDCMESRDMLDIVEKSVIDYVEKVHNQRALIDLTYLEMESKKKHFEEKRPLVVSLDKQDCQYSSLCGAKAASLAQLLHYQSNIARISREDSDMTFRVPSGVVLTRYAYDSILELNPELRQDERRLAGIVCQGKQDEIKCESERFQRMFSPESSQSEATLKIPQQLLDEIEKMMIVTFKMTSIDDSDKSFAVRSSSWGEDEDNMSAAGQLTTLLSIQGFKQLRDAIMICFGSKYSMTNLEYKRQHGLPIDMPMAIVIQEMIECDKAGVMFTCNPTSGDERQLLITANYGLGESVVSAAADPDSVLVNVEVDEDDPSDISKRRAKHIEQTTVGQKKVIMTSQSIRLKQKEENGLSDSRDDHHEEQQHRDDIDLSKCCLAEVEIFTLARCGLKLSHFFRCARDIEWGIKEGQLFLFQSRPITGLDTMNDFELLHEFSNGLTSEKEWLSRANVGEVMPNPVSPLSLTLSGAFHQLVANHMGLKFKIIQRDDCFSQRIGEIVRVGYFTFFSLRTSKIFSFEHEQIGKKRPMVARAMELALFGHEIDEPELAKASSGLHKPFSWKVVLSYLYNSLPHRYFSFKMLHKARKTMENVRNDVAKLRGSSMADLNRQLGIIMTEMHDSALVHLYATTLSTEYNQRMISILSKYIEDPLILFTCSSKLLTSHSDVFSARVPRYVDRMGKLIESNGSEELNRFLALNDEDSLKYITNSQQQQPRDDPKTTSELTQLFNKFMEEYGHRSYNEFDIASKRWRETPIVVIDMIKQYCRQNQLSTKQSTNNYNDNNVHDKPNNLIVYNGDQRNNVNSISKTNHIKSSGELLSDMDIHLGLKDRIDLDYFILNKCHQFIDGRESAKDLIIYSNYTIRLTVCLLADEMVRQNRIPDQDSIFYLTYGEIQRLIDNSEPTIVAQAQRRRRFIKKLDSWKFNEIISGHDFLPRHLNVDNDEAKQEKERLKLIPRISGTPACSGQVSGRICVVNGYSELNRVKSGDILVTYSTDIAFSPVFPIIGGIVTEIGGLISHGAVIAREYGIPTLIGIQNACSILKDGEQVILDANLGHLLRLDYSGHQ